MDLSPASRHQAAVAAGLAEAPGVPLILVHVIEPVKSPLAARLHLAGMEADRRAVAEDALQAIVAGLPHGCSHRGVAGLWRPGGGARQGRPRSGAGLVIMGLNGSPMLGPRMGSVTYRMLCLVHTLVLALPPEHMETLGARAASAAAPP